jgi:hypothetical protein
MFKEEKKLVLRSSQIPEEVLADLEMMKVREKQCACQRFKWYVTSAEPYTWFLQRSGCGECVPHNWVEEIIHPNGEHQRKLSSRIWEASKRQKVTEVCKYYVEIEDNEIVYTTPCSKIFSGTEKEIGAVKEKVSEHIKNCDECMEHVYKRRGGIAGCGHDNISFICGSKSKIKIGQSNVGKIISEHEKNCSACLNLIIEKYLEDFLLIVERKWM